MSEDKKRLWRVAVHIGAGKPEGFAQRWIEQLSCRGVEVKMVDCYRDDIMGQMSDCDALMWHWSHSDPRAILIARQVIASVEASGKPVFPDLRTCWHFDDKVGQKFLLEAIGAPLLPSHVFVDREAALAWAEKASFPVVFKLRGGAGSQNVRLVRTLAQARRLIKKMFGAGMPPLDQANLLRERYRQFMDNKSLNGLILLARGLARWIIPSKLERVKGREVGYCYFQEFMAGNNYDTRVIVIEGRAFAIRRFNRENDFRASGSGRLSYEHGAIDLRCVQIAFRVSEQLGAQCLAYDFVTDDKGNPGIVEISYGFLMEPYDKCEGFWDRELVWHAGNVEPQAWMVEGLLNRLSMQAAQLR